MTTQFPAHLPAPYRLDVSDWLEIADDTRIVEIIDGDVYMAPPPAVRHQQVAQELNVRLYAHLAQGSGGIVLFAPTGVKLDEETVLEPDLLVVFEEHLDRIAEKYVDGAPDLVIEILSPGTARRDLGVKRDHYERGGVAEYWIVDPEEETIEVLELVDGKFARFGLFGADDVLRSTCLPELKIRLDEIWM